MYYIGKNRTLNDNAITFFMPALASELQWIIEAILHYSKEPKKEMLKKLTEEYAGTPVDLALIKGKKLNQLDSSEFD